MLTDKDIAYQQIVGYAGYALAWIIEEDCVFTNVMNKQYFDLFTSFDNAIDISDQYPEHNGITVRLIKDDVILEDFQTSEYFGSILLSNPIIIDIMEYPYGAYVEPFKCKFIKDQFVFSEIDISNLDPFPGGKISGGQKLL